MSPLNDDTELNMPDISFTLDTSHFEISPWNDDAPRKRSLMSDTLDTSHSPIGPCGPLAQSPSGDNSRQASTAGWSSAFDRGEKILLHSLDVIDPEEPSNMRSLLASDLIHENPQSL